MKTPTEIVDEIAPVALFAIAADETPEQQEWAAVLLDACALIMQKCGYDGKMTLTVDQIKMNADGCRAWADELRKKCTLPDPFETGNVNTDANGFPVI